jgi:hypothetical protein
MGATSEAAPALFAAIQLPLRIGGRRVSRKVMTAIHEE